VDNSLQNVGRFIMQQVEMEEGVDGPRPKVAGDYDVPGGAAVGDGGSAGAGGGRGVSDININRDERIMSAKRKNSRQDNDMDDATEEILGEYSNSSGLVRKWNDDDNDGVDFSFSQGFGTESSSQIMTTSDVESLFDLSTVQNIDETSPVKFKRKHFSRPKSVLRGNRVEIVEEEFEVLEEERVEQQRPPNPDLMLPLFRGCGDRRVAPAMPMLRMDMMDREYNEPIRDRDKNWVLHSYRPVLDGPADSDGFEFPNTTRRSRTAETLAHTQGSSSEAAKTNGADYGANLESMRWSTTFKSMIRRTKLLRRPATISETPCIVTVYGVGITGRLFSDGGGDHRVIYVEAYSIWNSKVYTLPLNMVQIKVALASRPELFKAGMKYELLAVLIRQLYFDYTITIFPIPHVHVPDEAEENSPKPGDSEENSKADDASHHSLAVEPVVVTATHLTKPKVPKIGPQTVGDVIRGILDPESLPPGMPPPLLVQELRVAGRVLVNGATKRRRYYAALKKAQEDEFERQRLAWLAIPKRLRGFVVSSVMRSMGRFVVLSGYRMPLRPKVIHVRAHVFRECIKMDMSLSMTLINVFYQDSPNYKFWEKSHIHYYSLRTLRQMRFGGDPILPYLQLMVKDVSGSGSGAEELRPCILCSAKVLKKLASITQRHGLSIAYVSSNDFDFNFIPKINGETTEEGLQNAFFAYSTARAVSHRMEASSQENKEQPEPAPLGQEDQACATDVQKQLNLDLAAVTNAVEDRERSESDSVFREEPHETVRETADAVDLEASTGDSPAHQGDQVEKLDEGKPALRVAFESTDPEDEHRAAFPPVSPRRLIRTATFRLKKESDIPTDRSDADEVVIFENDTKIALHATPITAGSYAGHCQWQAFSHYQRPIPFSTRLCHRPRRCLGPELELTTRVVNIHGVPALCTFQLRIPATSLLLSSRFLTRVDEGHPWLCWLTRWLKITAMKEAQREEKERKKEAHRQQREEERANSNAIDDLLFDTNNEISDDSEDEDEDEEDSDELTADEMRTQLFDEIPPFELLMRLYFPQHSVVFSCHEQQSAAATGTGMYAQPAGQDPPSINAQSQQLLTVSKDDMFRLCSDMNRDKDTGEHTYFGTETLLEALSICHRSFHLVAGFEESQRIQGLWELIALCVLRRAHWVRLPQLFRSAYPSLKDIIAAKDRAIEEAAEKVRIEAEEIAEAARVAAEKAAEVEAKAKAAQDGGDFVLDAAATAKESLRSSNKTSGRTYDEEMKVYEEEQKLAEQAAVEKAHRDHRVKLLDYIQQKAVTALNEYRFASVAGYLIAEDITEGQITPSDVRVGFSSVIFRKNCKLSSDVDGVVDVKRMHVVVWQRGEELGVTAYDVMCRPKFPSASPVPILPISITGNVPSDADSDPECGWLRELEWLQEQNKRIDAYTILPVAEEQTTQVVSLRFLSPAERGMTLSLWLALELRCVESSLDEAVMEEDMLREDAEADALALKEAKKNRHRDDGSDQSSDWGEDDEHADDWKMELGPDDEEVSDENHEPADKSQMGTARATPRSEKGSKTNSALNTARADIATEASIPEVSITIYVDATVQFLR
jgi:hypothetical protein